MNDIESGVDKLKTLSDQYFKLFAENYPSVYENRESLSTLGPRDLIECGLDTQVALTNLGSTAISRMMFIGFDFLHPFHNPVDWYDWKENILKKNVPNTVFFSIAIREETELRRMKLHAQDGSWNAYCSLSDSEFSISKKRYSAYFDGSSASNAEQCAASENPRQPGEDALARMSSDRSGVFIDKAFFQENISRSENEPVDRLEKNYRYGPTH